MWLSNAMTKCPQLICIPYEFENYQKTSKLLYSIISSYTLEIKAISCDELYIDLTDLCNSMGIFDPLALIKVIREEIMEKTGCPASAGLGHSELIARLATRKAKPNGQFYVKRKEVIGFVRETPLKSIPGIGYSLLERLKENFGQIAICKDLYSVPLSRLQSILGEKQGKKIYDSIRGLSKEGMEIKDDVMRKSVSCDVNFGVRLKTKTDLDKFLTDLSRQVSKKLEEESVMGSTLTIKVLIRCPDAPIEPIKFGAHGPCDIYTKSTSISRKTNKMEIINECAQKLILARRPKITDIRGIGLQMTNLCKFEKIDKINGITRHLKYMPSNNLPQKMTRMTKIVKKPKSNLSDGQRYVIGRSIQKLPELKSTCICSGNHDISINMAISPTFTQILSLHCFFYQLVCSDLCSEAKKHYLKLLNSVMKEESSKRGEWIKVMESLRRDINKGAKKRYQILVLPKKLL